MNNKIEALVSSLPQEWKNKVTLDFAKMKTESPTLIDPKIEQSKYTISTIIQPDSQTRDQINNAVAPFILRQKGLFLQPSDGYHFTVQWSNFLNGNISKLIESVGNMTMPPLDLEIKLLYPSKPNLFAALVPQNDVLWMEKVRSMISGYFNSSSFTPILPEKLPLIWMSLARFTKDFDPQNLDQLVLELPEKTITANKFTLFLAKTDPFFTQKTAEIFLSKEF